MPPDLEPHALAGRDARGNPSLTGRRVLVVVFGDFGRSPRMQYHALALLRAGVEVEVVGYGDTAVLGELEEHPRVRLRLLAPPREGPDGRSVRLALAASALRFAVDSTRLLRHGLSIGRPDLILVQVPPTLPTLCVALLVRRARSAKLVADWHDFSYAQLAPRLGERHGAVRLGRRLEIALAPLPDASLCVSRAMSERLRQWGVRQPLVFHDKPEARFRPLSTAERAASRRRFAVALSLPDLAADDGSRALLVSASSWSTEEDFSLLVDALEHLRSHGGVPPLAIAVSGRGSLRRHWERRFAEIDSEQARLRTVWLPPEEYPLLLGAADLGLSFHRSSSGVDLPMKIADMFGAGLPVCAFDYGPVLSEVIRAGENGVLFRSGDDLARQLVALLAGFPRRTPHLDTLRQGVAATVDRRWGDEWNATVLPVLKRLV